MRSATVQSVPPSRGLSLGYVLHYGHFLRHPDQGVGKDCVFGAVLAPHKALRRQAFGSMTVSVAVDMKVALDKRRLST